MKRTTYYHRAMRIYDRALSESCRHGIAVQALARAIYWSAVNAAPA